MKAIAIEFIDSNIPITVSRPLRKKSRRRLRLAIVSLTLVLILIVTGVGAANYLTSRKKIDIKLNAASSLVLRGDSYVTSFIDADHSLSNIISNGYNIYYNKDNDANSWLSGKTLSLSGGGKLIPYSFWI